jgi:hypothetical protein
LHSSGDEHSDQEDSDDEHSGEDDSGDESTGDEVSGDVSTGDEVSGDEFSGEDETACLQASMPPPKPRRPTKKALSMSKKVVLQPQKAVPTRFLRIRP